MRILIIVALFCCSANLALGDSSRPELPLDELWVGDAELEVSGIAMIDGSLHIVSDGKDDTTLYKLQKKSNRVSFEKGLDLTTLTGFKDYSQSLAEHKELKKKDRRFDLEGLAVCGDTIYFANERVREVFAIKGKQLVPLKIDFSHYKHLNDGGANAGFEGIAVDCAEEKMFVAKERDPRQLFKIDMKTWKVIKTGDFIGSNRQGQKVINPFDGESLMPIGPDVADLFFDNGSLYVLERNTYEIAKLDPNTFEVLGRVSYFRSETPVYEKPEPFGLAEALYMTKDRIFIGIDNNGFPLGSRIRKQFKLDGNFSAIMLFKRPVGF